MAKTTGLYLVPIKSYSKNGGWHFKKNPTVVALVKLITNITLFFKKDPSFMVKFAKYGKRGSFFEYIHFQNNSSIVSPFMDIVIKLFFSDSSTKIDFYHVIFRVIKARTACKKNQLEKRRQFSQEAI